MSARPGSEKGMTEEEIQGARECYLTALPPFHPTA